MRAISLLLLCIVGSMLVSLTVANYGSGPNICCFEYYNRRVQLDKVHTYEFTDGRCPMPAVILRTIAHVRICVNPNADWVKRIMTQLDERKP